MSTPPARTTTCQRACRRCATGSHHRTSCNHGPAHATTGPPPPGNAALRTSPGAPDASQLGRRVRELRQGLARLRRQIAAAQAEEAEASLARLQADLQLLLQEATGPMDDTEAALGALGSD